METFNKIYRDQIISYKSSLKNEYDSPIITHRLFFRPISFYLSTVLIYLGLSANQTTLISFLILLLSFFIAFLNTPDSILYSSLLFVLYYTLDFADGNIARYNKNSSYLGKFFDGSVDLVGKLISLVLGFSYYLKSDHNETAMYTMLFGTMFSVLFIILEYIKYRIHFFSLTAQLKFSDSLKSNVINQTPRTKKFNGLRIIKFTYHNILEFSPFLILICVYFNLLMYVFAFYSLLIGMFHTAETYFLFRAHKKYLAYEW